MRLGYRYLHNSTYKTIIDKEIEAQHGGRRESMSITTHGLIIESVCILSRVEHGTEEEKFLMEGLKPIWIKPSW